jgi:hypothetical protein
LFNIANVFSTTSLSAGSSNCIPESINCVEKIGTSSKTESSKGGEAAAGLGKVGEAKKSHVTGVSVESGDGGIKLNKCGKCGEAAGVLGKGDEAAAGLGKGGEAAAGLGKCGAATAGLGEGDGILYSAGFAKTQHARTKLVPVLSLYLCVHLFFPAGSGGSGELVRV